MGEAMAAQALGCSGGDGGLSLPDIRTERRSRANLAQNQTPAVLWTVFILLLLLWLIVMVTLQAVSFWVHLLLVAAAVLLVYRLLGKGHSA